MSLREYLLVVAILCAVPSSAFAFPAPEAMGAISFALSSIWAHLSAVFGAIIGIGPRRNTSKENHKKAFVFLLSLLVLSILINIGQSYLSSNHLAVLNEVNFQKVQPVPYPNVERTFNENDSVHALSVDHYLKNIASYQLVPVITQEEHKSNSLQEFSENSPSVILNAQGYVIKTTGISNNKKPVLIDWNNDLSRIAINDSLRNSETTKYKWLKGGYQALIDHLSEKEDKTSFLDAKELFSFEENENPLFIDVSEYHAYQERGYFYSAVSAPYSAFFSGDIPLEVLTEYDGPIVFLDFYENKSKAVASWYYQVTNQRAYVLDGGYEKLTELGLDWVPFYPNQYRLLSPSQIYDWHIGTNDVVFLDGRSSDKFDRSEERWLTISTPVEYSNLEDLYLKVEGLDKDKRYAGFVYDQGNAFKMLVLGHALHKKGYTWLGLFTRPQVLSYAEIDDFQKNRPHRIEWWQNYVAAMEAYPKALGKLFHSLDLSGWVFLLAYGFMFRLLLLPVTIWTSQPVFMQKSLSGFIKLTANVVFVGILILFAVLLQKWIYDFGDLHWSVIPLIEVNLANQSLFVAALTTGLIGVQLSVTPGLRLFSAGRRLALGLFGLLVIGYFLSGLASGLLIYVFGITLASLLTGFAEFAIQRFRSPVHSDYLPILKTGKESQNLLCASEVSEASHGIKAGRLGEAYQLGMKIPEFFVLNQSTLDTLDIEVNRKRLYFSAKRLSNRVIVRSAALTEDETAARIGRLSSSSISLNEISIDEFAAFIKSVMESQSHLEAQHRQVIVQKYISASQYAVGVSRDLERPEYSRVEYGPKASATEGEPVYVQLISNLIADDGLFSKIHNQIRSLELYYGQPIDVECAFASKAAWILQVRPFHPLYFCQPREVELIEHRSKNLKGSHDFQFIDEAGGSPSPLSLSILKSLYGTALTTDYGRPCLAASNKKPQIKTIEQFCELISETADLTHSEYETVLLLRIGQASDELLVSHINAIMDLLKSTMELSIQLRISRPLRSNLNKTEGLILGYWSEDQLGLQGSLHHPSVFLSKADFDVSAHVADVNLARDKPIPYLPMKLDKASRVMTDVHYLTARLYTGLSILVREIGERSLQRHGGSKEAVFGARIEELLSKQWDCPALWESRQNAIRTLQESQAEPVSFTKLTTSASPIEGAIHTISSDSDLSDIPDNAIVVLDCGRSDIIQSLERINGIICRTGGENSHWMMVARSLGIYAISGDRSLNIAEWESGCAVSILTFN